MATKLKFIETNEGPRLSAPEGVVADIVPAAKVPDFVPAPTRKRRAGWNSQAQLVRGTSEHGNEGQGNFVQPPACVRAHTR